MNHCLILLSLLYFWMNVCCCKRDKNQHKRVAERAFCFRKRRFIFRWCVSSKCSITWKIQRISKVFNLAPRPENDKKIKQVGFSNLALKLSTNCESNQKCLKRGIFGIIWHKMCTGGILIPKGTNFCGWHRLTPNFCRNFPTGIFENYTQNREN